MKVSIITVVWNAAATIGDTMRSVAAQSYRDLEHVVIDGASTDDTAAIVRALATHRTRLISEPDKGLYDAMNKGIAAVSGDVIGFLNADDFFCRTDAVDLIAAGLADADAVSASVAIVATGNTAKLKRTYPSEPFAPWMLRFGHMPPHPGFYTRRSAMAAVGAFDLSAGTAADFDWMVRFFLVHHLTAKPIAPTLVTMRAGGASNSGVSSRARANAHASAALRRHGRGSIAPLLWTKYLVKSWQFVLQPHEWPGPPAVRWLADADQQSGAGS